MSIITISRGSYSRGKEVAEKVAQKLGYECVARDIIIEASEQFNIPEAKLVRALHDSPSILNRFTYGKEKYTAFIRYALLKHLKKDNVVYHGLAGHFFLKEIPHVLKIRILADMDVRIEEEMKRENISKEDARRILEKDDAERRSWSLNLYGIDTWNPSLYDMVLHIGQISVDEAVTTIVNVSQMSGFQSTEASQAVFNDHLLAAQIQSLLIEEFPTSNVICKNGKIFISCEGAFGQKDAISDQINKKLSHIPNLEGLDIHISPVLVPD